MLAFVEQTIMKEYNVIKAACDRGLIIYDGSF